MEILTYNANTLFSDMLWRFKTSGVPVDTRNGPALRIAEPVLTRVVKPRERVLFDSRRDANPIFHLMESIWMLAGRRDVEFLQQFNSKIGQYSDDGEVFNAAYGHRMRHHFGQDQLIGVINQLRDNSDSRQAVVQLWDPDDLNKSTLDKACNTQLIFEVFNGRLNLTVINRSNDAWYGYCGANIVHFTVIQEFVAAAVGKALGEYRTFTNNLHIYTELYDAGDYLKNPPNYEINLYSQGVSSLPLLDNSNHLKFLQECETFCENPFDESHEYFHPFFSRVARPMAMVSRVRKLKQANGREWAQKIRAADWRRAVFDWIDRREAAKR